MNSSVATYRHENGRSIRQKTRIAIVDDHPIVRQGIKELINNEKDLEVCAEAESADEAMRVFKDAEAEMAIVDISLKDASGVELIKKLKEQHANMSILALSMHDEFLYAERVLRAGARGYIMKHEGAEKLIIAIRKILNNQIYISDKMSEKMMRKFIGGKLEIGESPTDCLSNRELEVLELIGKGHGTRQIAEKLSLSIKTVETYRSHIKEKLNIAGATELLQYAIHWISSEGQK